MAVLEACPAEQSAGQVALSYAARGWPVFPVAARGKIPLTAHGLNDATTDTTTIIEWWTSWPTANVGITTGPPGPTVIDCDGPIGRHEWSKFIAGIGWELTPWSSTGGGGWHIYYAGNPDVRNRVGWLRKVDVRGVGGYVVAPPSIHESGADYYWHTDPTERDLQPLPDRVLDALKTAPVLPVRPLSSVRLARSIGDKYAAVAFDNELDRVRTAPEGTRNATLVAAAFNLGQLVGVGKLDANEVAGGLLNAATARGLPQTEALRTIDSGMRAGIERPRR